jgi:hypothetical protein
LVLLRSPFVGVLRPQGFDKDEPVGFAGAGEDVAGDATGLDPHLRRASEDIVPSPAVVAKGMMHPLPLPYRLIVACNASTDDRMPASVDIVKSSISRLTQSL